MRKSPVIIYPGNRKSCTVCGEIKSLDEFYRTKDAFSGRHSYCKECEKKGRRGSKKRLEFARLDQIKNRIKYQARREVKMALTVGKLCRPNNCEKCQSGLRLNAHHDDYSKPLDVRWLCTSCHYRVHHG